MGNFGVYLFLLFISSVLGNECLRTNRRSAKKCVEECIPSSGCFNKNKECRCDSDCGYSCVKRNLKCDPLTIRNGKVLGNGRHFNATVRIKCNKGYTMTGSSERRCRANANWDGKRTRCRKVCVDPGMGTYANRDEESKKLFKVSTKLHYYCLVGFTTNDPLTITCDENEQWSSPPPVCKLKTCGKPKLPDNAIMKMPRFGRKTNSYTVGQRIRLKCNPGFYSRRSGVMLCRNLVNGNVWLTNPGFRCIPRSCSAPRVPKHGRKSGLVYTFKEKVEYYCDYCYKLDGPAYRTCQADGEWSDMMPSCIRAECQDPGDIANGEVVILNKPIYCDSVVNFKCYIGYNLNGPSQIKCLSTGNWNNKKPRCDIVNCGDPGNPINGITNANYGYTYQKDVKFSCNDGYVLEGNTLATCQQNGQWSSELPKCLEKCSDPSQATNADLFGDKFFHGKSVIFLCPQNYVLEPLRSSILTCENGKWNKNIPQCKAPCQQLPSRINYGYVRSHSRKHGSRASFSCWNGYKLTGSSSISCNDGKWSHPVPKCLAICRRITRLQNGVVNGRGNIQGDELEFKCNRNYVLEGRKKMTCQSNRRWSATLPRCKAPCQQQVDPKNGKIIRYGFIHNKQVQFECNRDYVMEGSGTLTCLDGKWSSQPPRCLAPCPQLNRNYFYNGNIKNNGFRHGETTTFTCNHHYVMEGQAKLRCFNGKWSSSTPTCEAPCVQPPAPINGRIFKNGYRHKESISFKCNTGYTLIGPSTRLCNFGIWSEDHIKTRCEVVVCRHPGHPVHGKTIADRGLTYNQNVSFVCNEGYVLDGHSSATCQYDKKWSKHLPECKKKCSDPLQTTNARLRGNYKFFDGQSVRFFCSQNYVLEPSQSKEVTCKNGKWNKKIPLCKAPCQQLPSKINYGDVWRYGRKHGSSATFACRNGYKISGNALINCNNGSWSHPLPKCLAICKKITSLQNGFVNGTGNLQGDELKFKCNENYVLKGKKKMTCQSNRRWSAILPSCKATVTTTKSVLPSQIPPSTGTFHTTLTSSDTHATDLEPTTKPVRPGQVPSSDTIRGTLTSSNVQTTDLGMATEPAVTTTVPSNVHSSYAPPVDVIISCSDPGRPTHGKTIANDGYTYGKKVRFSCNRYYVLEGSNFATCQKNGQWSDDLPKCLASCGYPDGIRNGYRIGRKTSHGSTVSFSCRRGYQLTGSSKITCNNGLWSAPNPRCKAVNCGDPGNPSNGVTLAEQGYTLGKYVTFRCNTGYTRKGLHFSKCQDTGKWFPDLPKCVSSCPELPSIENGHKKLFHSQRKGHSATFGCSPGYKLSGKSKIICRKRTWSDPVPKCLPKPCKRLQPPQNGKIWYGQPHVMSDVVQFTCNQNYRLQGSSFLTCKNGSWSHDPPTCIR